MKGKEDALATRNLVPNESVYGEKRVSIQEPSNDTIGFRFIRHVIHFVLQKDLRLQNTVYGILFAQNWLQQLWQELRTLISVQEREYFILELHLEQQSPMFLILLDRFYLRTDCKSIKY